jgi:hypothetical protein
LKQYRQNLFMDKGKDKGEGEAVPLLFLTEHHAMKVHS